MRAVVIIFLLAVSPICMTTKSYANDIFLKCSSLSFGGQVWEGNVSYVKIYPDKNEALFQDTGETTSYWINHKIRSINPDQIWIAECRPADCSIDNISNNRIDRVTGIMSLVSEYNGEWHEMATWQCQKANVF